MKKLILMVMILMMLVPISAHAAMADELDETDCVENVTTRRDTSGWTENADYKYIANFFARNVSAKANQKSVTLNTVVTTSAKGFMVQVSPSESFNRKVKTYYIKNSQYVGPVVCRDIFQIKLYKSGRYSSWGQQLVTQGGKILHTDRKYHPGDQGASYALVYNNALMNRIRKTVNIKKSFKLQGITNGSKYYVRIRCVYQGFHKNVYSRWVVVKVR